MPIQEISLGVVANDGEGDPLREGGERINQNFTNPLNAASYEVGADAGQIPRNSDLPTFGTAAQVNTGTSPSEVPTNADLGTAAQVDTGTGASEIPRNSDLGTAAQANTGLATGQVPTADQLSMVGETVNYTGANFNPNSSSGIGSVRLLRNISGFTNVDGQTGLPGSNYQFAFADSSGMLLSSNTPVGTWKCVAGVSIINQQFGYYVRIA